MIKVLFVCTGNTCRSPMAQGFFTQAVAAGRSGLSGIFTAESAGIYAFEDDPASQYSIKVMHEVWGIDISGHRARNINEADIRSSQLILTMTEAHKYALLAHFPETAGKVFTLKEYLCDKPAEGGKKATNPEYNAVLDITDPYGKSPDVYKICASEIKNAVDLLILKLKNDSNLCF